jgi:hypothetical protein
LVVSRPVGGEPDRLNLQWTDNSQDPAEEDVFAVYHWTDQTPVTEVAQVAGVAGAPNQVSTTITNLSPNTRHYFFVVARRGSDNSLPSNTEDEFTWAEVPQWSAEPISRTDKSLTLSWLRGNNPLGTRYRLEVSSDSFNLISASNTANLFATINGLLSNTVYQVRLRAMDPIPGEFSNPILSTNTLAAIPLPPLFGDRFVSYVSSITARWASNENSVGTIYQLDSYLDEARTEFVASSRTLNTSGTIDNLNANTAYWFTVRAENVDGGLSGPLELGRSVTLPTNFLFASSPVPNSTVWYGNNTGLGETAFSLTTNAFAQDHVAYIRYKWLPFQNTFVWPSDNNQDLVPDIWQGGNLVISTPTSAAYWLHMKAYNEVGQGNPETEISTGPFNVDLNAPLPDPASITNVITSTGALLWTGAVAVDPNGPHHADLGAMPYGWAFEGGAEQFQAELSSRTENLSPNTIYSMILRTRDNAEPSNITQTVVRSTSTLQNIPSGLTVLEVTRSSMIVEILGNFPNVNLGLSGLQLRLTSANSDFVTNRTTSTRVGIEGLNGSTEYQIYARAFNQDGVATEWSSSVSTTTFGTAPRITADRPAWTLQDPRYYPANTVVRYSDDGAFPNLIAYYKFVVTPYTFEPSGPKFESAPQIRANSWSYLYSASSASYMHIRSYDEADRSQRLDYLRLGPWIIDADPPQIVGISTFTVHGTSSMTFTVGEIEDLGLSGFPADPYSFDSGATYQVDEFLLKENLTANSSNFVDVVVRDAVGNLSTPPLHMQAYTHQNAPSGMVFVDRRANQFVVEAQGNFPNPDAGNSGLNFRVLPDGIQSGWLPVNRATFTFTVWNTSHSFTSQARNGDGIETGWSPEIVGWTLAKPPSVECINVTQKTWTNISTFSFRVLNWADNRPGPTRYESYRWAWSTDPVYNFDGSLLETTWIPLSETDFFVTTATFTGRWYLHIRSVNHEGDLTPPQDTMWFGYDVSSPTPNPAEFGTPEAGSNFITFHAIDTSTDPHSGFGSSPFVWNFENQGIGYSIVPSSTVFGLSPNTEYSMGLRVRDAVGNQTDPETIQSTFTLAAPPLRTSSSGRPFGYSVYKTSITVDWLVNGNPAGTRQELQLSRFDLFDPVLEAQTLLVPSSSTSFGVSGNPLIPNTTYFMRIRALNESNIPTAWVHLGTVTTKPLPPEIIVSTDAANLYIPVMANTRFLSGTTFYADTPPGFVFGEGAAEYYRWRWDNSPTFPFYEGSNEARIDGTTPIPQISTQVFSSRFNNVYWLHVGSYRGGNENDNQLVPSTDVGPFIISSSTDGFATLYYISLGTTSIEWAQLTQSTSVVGEPNPVPPYYPYPPYGFQLLPDGTTTWHDTLPNPLELFVTSVTNHLEPNHSYTMRAYVRHGINGGAPISSDELTLVTRQADYQP